VQDNRGPQPEVSVQERHRGDGGSDGEELLSEDGDFFESTECADMQSDWYRWVGFLMTLACGSGLLCPRTSVLQSDQWGNLPSRRLKQAAAAERERSPLGETSRQHLCVPTAGTTA
jgi:hypothetical protein